MTRSTAPWAFAADALTNLDFRHFHEDHRIPVDLDDMKFGVLNDLFGAGDTYMTELEVARSKAKLQAEKVKSVLGRGNGKKQKRKAGDALRERDLW